MSGYRYGLRNRPAMYGTCPPHWMPGEAHPDFSYGTIVYEQALALEDVYRYELALLDPLPILPLYPTGTVVKSFNSGKQEMVGRLDGEYFLDDQIISCAADWRSVKKWMMYAPAATPDETDDETAELIVEYYVGLIDQTWYVFTQVFLVPSWLETDEDTEAFAQEKIPTLLTYGDIAFMGVSSWHWAQDESATSSGDPERWENDGND